MALESISFADFDRFRHLLHQHSGIHLADNKQPLLIGRLGRRLRELGLDSYADYYQRVSQPGGEVERQRMIDLLTTNETHFFREAQHFAYLREQILPKHPASTPFRAWSAASSTGEEAYTLAFELAEAFGEGAWEIIGTDISHRVVEQARLGIYPIERAKEIPIPLLKKYCLRGVRSQDGAMRVMGSLTRRARFLAANLLAPLPDIGRFDVIFLRNVMIYFDMDTKRRVVDNVLSRLKPGGTLFIGHAETLQNVSERVQLVKPTIYRLPAHP